MSSPKRTGYHTDSTNSTQNLKSFLEYGNPDAPTTLEWEQVLKKEISSVYSWRGPSRKKDIFGWIEPNDFSLNRYRVDYGTCGIGYIVNPNYRVKVGGHYLQKFHTITQIGQKGISSVLVGQAINAMHQAQHEAYASANSPRCPGLTWIAEGKELVGALFKLGVKVISLSSRTQARVQLIKTIKSVKDKADQIAGAWLAYRYAVMPLLLQIADILELMKEPGKELETFTGYLKNKEITETEEFTLVVANSRLVFLKTVKYSVRGACKLYPAALKSTEDFGFGAHDALLAMWEILTLSFVVDWFVGVGSWLAAFRPGSAQNIYQSNTYIVDITTTLSLKSSSSVNPAYETWAEVRDSVSRESIVVRDTKLEVASKLPIFDRSALSMLRQTDAAALLFKFFGGRRR